MLVVSPATLKRFRATRHCELCNKVCWDGCDPHHFRKRGLGGGYRLDISINLIAVCRSCHNDCESKKIPEWQVINAIAFRENTKPAPILAVMDWLLGLDKYTTPAGLRRELRRLHGEARRLAVRTLKEIRDGSETGSGNQGRRQGQGICGDEAIPGQPNLRPGIPIDRDGWFRA